MPTKYGSGSPTAGLVRGYFLARAHSHFGKAAMSPRSTFCGSPHKNSNNITKALLFLFSLPLAAQSLSLSCPPPAKFSQPIVCKLNFAGGASALEWRLSANPPVSIKVQSLVSGKTVSAGTNSLYALLGMNATPLAGAVASVTIPGRAGSVTLTLSKPLGSSATGHAVEVNPGVSVTVQ